MPTFNIVLATIGRKCIVNMLKSLENQLNKEDCLTIIFDVVKPIQEVYGFNFKCKLKIIHQKENLGARVGETIREFYKNKLEERDFIMHADDDDEYLPGSFDKLRKKCKDRKCLYIAKMSFIPFSNRYVPTDINNIFKDGNIGTPNGIIPYHLNKIGEWGHKHGGDGKFYIDISKKCKRFELLDILIYQIRPHEILSILANKYGLNKSISTGCHNNIPGYIKLFQNIRYFVKNLLEIGIGSLENGQMGGIRGHVSKKYKTGNSLKCWSKYFPNSNIYGIDIYAHPELNRHKIMTFVADQSSEQQLKSVIEKINSPLDIIIDDGSHVPSHQVFSFMYLYKYLSPNGIYVIEDVKPSKIEGFKNLSIFPEHFKEYINKNFVVKYFDTRNSCNRFRKYDFMISFTKK